MSNPEILSTRVEYGYALVKVTPFEAVADNGKRAMISSYFGWLADEGRYLRGRGRLILKSGDLGVREMDMVWAVPANVQEALVAAIKAAK